MIIPRESGCRGYVIGHFSYPSVKNFSTEHNFLQVWGATQFFFQKCEIFEFLKSRRKWPFWRFFYLNWWIFPRIRDFDICSHLILNKTCKESFEAFDSWALLLFIRESILKNDYFFQIWYRFQIFFEKIEIFEFFKSRRKWPFWRFFDPKLSPVILKR